MAKRYTRIFDGFTGFTALREAAQAAIKGKRAKLGAAAFYADLETECLRLERQLQGGTYQSGSHTKIEVWNPKHSIVSAAPFRDHVVPHALCSVVGPMFSRSFIANSFANPQNVRTHRAILVYERYRDVHSHVLSCDIWRYFPAIDHEILKGQFRRHLACERILALLDLIVDGSNAQETVALYFDGDDLFMPIARRRSLPIGNLTSQFFANLYLYPLDHFVTEMLRAPFVRYVDDFALFHNDPCVLEDWQQRISRYLDARRLRLHPRKTFLVPTHEASIVRGFVLLPGRRRRTPEDNVRRFRNRLRSVRYRHQAGSATDIDIATRIRSWIALAEHAGTRQLRAAMFKNADPVGSFDGTQTSPGISP